MKLLEKLEVLADAAKYDASCASSGSNRTRPKDGLGNSSQMGICHSFTPDGRCVSLLKILLTNMCIYDCSYCVNRLSSDTKRAAFTPAEVVQLTLDFYRRNYIEGLFLSSGIIKSPGYTMELLTKVAKELRTVHRFGGYIHLKAAPGASESLLEEAGLWADRLSVNIELPTQEDLNKLAPAKTHVDAENSMGSITHLIDENRRENQKVRRVKRRYAPGGQSTQMVVGATETPDLTILKKASALYNGFGLRRVYYSAFSPIPHADPTLPLVRPPLVREHRLYQADWLLRFYGFKVEELATEKDQNLSLKEDPKLAWAKNNPEFFPVDLNRAPVEMILRVPGIGVRNAQRILKIRKYHQLRFEDLKKLRISVKKSGPFIVTVNYLPPKSTLKTFEISEVKPVTQLDFLDSLTSASTGEL